MSAVDMGLLLGAVAVSAFALWRGNLRVILWIVVCGISYAISTTYWRTGLPNGELVTAMGDGTVVLLVYALRKRPWETMIMALFQISVAVSAYYAASRLGYVGKLSHNDYSYMLETINLLALFWLFGTTALQGIGTSDGSPGHHFGHLHRFVRSLYRPRTKIPFFRVWR